MLHTVAVVCGAGVSSTFLARAVRQQLAEQHLDWIVEPLAVDQLADRLDHLSLVLVGQHMVATFAEVSALCRAGGVPVAQLGAVQHDLASREALSIITATHAAASTDATKGISHG